MFKYFCELLLKLTIHKTISYTQSCLLALIFIIILEVMHKLRKTIYHVPIFFKRLNFMKRGGSPEDLA